MSLPNPGYRCNRCGEPIPTQTNWEYVLWFFIGVVAAFALGASLL